MDKRYQVFVSSTFRDLQEERKEVMQVLLEMDAIPAGMELFPAANEDAWKVIERIIAMSDYYVLIIGGRYGTLDSSGISYTEREYDHAIKCGVPVLPFLHEEPENISVGKSESKEEAKGKLEAFREKVRKSHHFKLWKDAEQLGSRVSRGLMHQIKVMPRVGWVRANQVGGTDAILEVNSLRKQVETLTTALEKSRTEPPKGAEELQGGEDFMPFVAAVSAYSDEAILNMARYRSQYARSEHTVEFRITWNEAFGACGPLMLKQSAAEYGLKQAIEASALEILLRRDPWYKKYSANKILLSQGVFQKIKLQFVALGFICKTDENRDPKETANLWTLTPYGEVFLLRSGALRKTEKSPTQALET